MQTNQNEWWRKPRDEQMKVQTEREQIYIHIPTNAVRKSKKWNFCQKGEQMEKRNQNTNDSQSKTQHNN